MQNGTWKYTINEKKTTEWEEKRYGENQKKEKSLQIP